MLQMRKALPLFNIFDCALWEKSEWRRHWSGACINPACIGISTATKMGKFNYLAAEITHYRWYCGMSRQFMINMKFLNHYYRMALMAFSDFPPSGARRKIFWGLWHLGRFSKKMPHATSNTPPVFIISSGFVIDVDRWKNFVWDRWRFWIFPNGSCHRNYVWFEVWNWIQFDFRLLRFGFWQLSDDFEYPPCLF